jgi:hypothetical protein
MAAGRRATESPQRRQRPAEAAGRGPPAARAADIAHSAGAAARAPALAHLERHVAALRAADVPRADLARQQAVVVVVVVHGAAAAARRGAPPLAASRRLGCVSAATRARRRVGM